MKSIREEANKIRNAPARLTYYRKPGDYSGKVKSTAHAVSFCVAAEDILTEACLRISGGDTKRAYKALELITQDVRDKLDAIKN